MTRKQVWAIIALVIAAAIVALFASGVLGEIIKTIRWVPGS